MNRLKKWLNRRLKRIIINKLLSNPNHRPSFETTVLIADDIFKYITYNSDGETPQL